MRNLNWGILGTGSIAKKFARGLALTQRGDLVAVGSRDLAKAQSFTAEFGGNPVGSYEEVLNRDDVDAVYISLPHHLHPEWTIKAAQAKKAILCEKPFALTSAEAKAALQACKDNDVFFKEAFMYRAHPQTVQVMKMIKEGVIGEPKMMHGEFGYNSSRGGDGFRFDGLVGGGGLYDVGCYPISFAMMLGGPDLDRVSYHPILADSMVTDSQYDSHGCGQLHFKNGFKATFGTGVHLDLSNTVTIYGTLGRIHLPQPWFCNGQIVVTLAGREPEVVKSAQVADLWGHQAAVVAEYLDKKESPSMTWRDTIVLSQILETMTTWNKA